MLDLLAEATRAHAAGKLVDAITGYREVLRQRPTHRQGKHQLGLALVDAECWNEAIGVLRDVVAEQKDNAEALNSLGLCHSRLLQYDEAMRWFERAIEVDRQFALAHFNRGLILLKHGRYAEGWQEYDWRWQLPSFTPFRCPQPRWAGEDISDKRLLVHSEQGNGDHIQFWRYLRLARARCRELIYVGPEKLAELAAEVAGVDESRTPGNIPRDRFDVFVPLLSLPTCLALEADTVTAERYLRAPPHVQVPSIESEHKVGFVWPGSPTHKDDRRRSIALEAMAVLFDVSDIDACSFQYPVQGQDIEFLRQHGVRNLEAALAGYSRTAAYAEQMDLFITVDTSIAHLAGALGRPTWVLLASDADWRWGLDGERSDWYGSVRLFRQRPGEGWPEVLQRVAQALVEWRRRRSEAAGRAVA